MQIVSPKTNVLRPKEVYKTLIFQYYLRHMTWCIGPIHPYWNQMCTTFLISSSLTWVVPAHSRSIVFAFLESCMLKLLEHLNQPQCYYLFRWNMQRILVYSIEKSPWHWSDENGVSFLYVNRLIKRISRCQELPLAKLTWSFVQWKQLVFVSTHKL